MHPFVNRWEFFDFKGSFGDLIVVRNVSLGSDLHSFSYRRLIFFFNWNKNNFEKKTKSDFWTVYRSIMSRQND